MPRHPQSSCCAEFSPGGHSWGTSLLLPPESLPVPTPALHDCRLPVPHRASAWVVCVTLQLPPLEVGPWEGAFLVPQPSVLGWEETQLWEGPESTSWSHCLCHSINSQESSAGISPIT